MSIFFILAFPAPASSESSGPKNENTTLEAMHEIFAQLQILLPAAIEKELGDPERAPEIKLAFDRMLNRIDALPRHGAGLDPGARLFGRALSRDVRRARDFFRRGQYENASFFVESLVDDCAGCHTRRPATDALITQGFVENAALERLEPLELAAIAAATRRFDEAMDRYEAAFRESDLSPGVSLGSLIRYLTVAIRVQRDPARAKKSLGELVARPGTSSTVRQDIEHWIKTLDRLSVEDLAGTSLDGARKATASADQVAEYPSDPKALIEHLVASSQLQDLVSLPQESPDAAAEVYELLGRAELGIAPNAWMSRADLYWETAIRIAPKSPAAARSFKHLEEETRAGFTGSGGTRLPDEEVERLAELAALVSNGSRSPFSGETLFRDHCIVCHGEDGQGRGALSAQLMWSPADLTRIATRRGGKFPKKEVFGLIARRDPLGSHQSPEMPRWGKYWTYDSKIDALVEYLRSIQQP